MGITKVIDVLADIAEFAAGIAPIREYAAQLKLVLWDPLSWQGRLALVVGSALATVVAYRLARPRLQTTVAQHRVGVAFVLVILAFVSFANFVPIRQVTEEERLLVGCPAPADLFAARADGVRETPEGRSAWVDQGVGRISLRRVPGGLTLQAGDRPCDLGNRATAGEWLDQQFRVALQEVRGLVDSALESGVPPGFVPRTHRDLSLQHEGLQIMLTATDAGWTDLARIVVSEDGIPRMDIYSGGRPLTGSDVIAGVVRGRVGARAQPSND